MTKVIFYEKPGCINNTRQKKLLMDAGHDVLAKNLLTEPWTGARLLAFFHDLPVKAWFNQSAPEVKSGAVDPDLLTAEQAVYAMLANPLLIRRPLIEIGARKIVGFESRDISALVGADLMENNELESCSINHTRSY